MFLRAQESALASVTGGNGAIYAVRKEAYVEVDPIMGHDLSFPFRMVKNGWRAVYAPAARAEEKMVPSIEGEWARKRRMMSHGWPIVFKGGLADPRGYSPLYALMIVSHRLLRYGTPFLHVLTAIATLALLRRGRIYQAGRRRAGRAARRRVLRFEGQAGAGRPLLRPDHGRARRRPVRLAAPRHARRVGRARGHALTVAPYLSSRRKRALDLALAGGALLVASPIVALATVAVRLESHGSPIYRQPRVGKDGHDFEVIKLRTMVSGAEHIGAGMAVDAGRRPDHPRRRAAAPDVDRRAAEPDQRAARRDVPGRPAADAAQVRSTPTPTASGCGWRCARASAAGRRSMAARRCPGPSGSSWTSGTSSTRRCGSTCGSSTCQPAWPSPVTASIEARPAAGLDRYGTTSGPLSMCASRKVRSASKTLGFIVLQPSWLSQAVAATAYGIFVPFWKSSMW